MQQEYKIYRTLSEQSVYDICLNTYGTLDLLSKLMTDNGISSVSRKLPQGSSIRYDERYVNDQKFAAQGYVFATRASLPGTFLLDLYPLATAAYSTRRLNSDYPGTAFCLRRSLDNREQDIGFDEDGHLDIKCMQQFLAGSAGYITTWYDQTGKGQHFAQSDKDKQPMLVEISPGRYALKSDGLNDSMRATIAAAIQQNFTYALIANFIGGTGERCLLHGRATDTNSMLIMRIGGSARLITQGYLYTHTWALNKYEVIIAIRTPTDGLLRRNMVSTTATTKLANAYDMKHLRIFGEMSLDFATALNNCESIVPEFIIWNQDHSINAQGINDNMNKYFKIY
ncbi:MAG: hypothetical protein EOP56_08275 [Sphingobacteriales bacterium]|nr:MAG: hypothetical protein EOP56_08275 [Sphingobacteriales bacterium]